jgi:hypothetical protein
MNTIEKITVKLSAYPDVQYSESADGIEVHPRDRSGFAVGLRITPSAFTVSCEDWHDEFTSEKETLDCFGVGLSPKCRLAIVFRGDTETKWVVEGFENGAWHRTPRPGCSCGHFGVGASRVPSESGRQRRDCEPL